MLGLTEARAEGLEGEFRALEVIGGGLAEVVEEEPALEAGRAEEEVGGDLVATVALEAAIGADIKVFVANEGAHEVIMRQRALQRKDRPFCCVRRVGEATRSGAGPNAATEGSGEAI